MNLDETAVLSNCLKKYKSGLIDLDTLDIQAIVRISTGKDYSLSDVYHIAMDEGLSPKPPDKDSMEELRKDITFLARVIQKLDNSPSDYKIFAGLTAIVEREFTEPTEFISQRAVANKDKAFCKNGHPFTKDNTYYRNKTKHHPNGGRSCKECHSLVQKRAKLRKRSLFDPNA